MAGGINPSVKGTDTFASHMRQINQRLASLERAASNSGGGGGGGDAVTQFWNSAWGVLVHTPSPATVVTVAATSTPIVTSSPVGLLAGRKYRVRGGVRAWQTTPTTANSDLTLVVSGPFAPGSNSHDQYATTGGGYSQAEWVAVFDCTADTPGATYALTGTTTVAATLYGGGNAGVTVEDVGPTTKIATDPPPASDWAAYDDRYVNVTGDAMSGKLEIAGTGELLKLSANALDQYAYIGFYDHLGARHGWLGKLSTAPGPMYYVSDPTFDLNLVGGAALNLTAGPGGVNVPDPNGLFFGSTTRQMLNLYSNTFGIGVQSSTLYFRASGSSSFSWFRSGVHDNAATTPGAGGVEQMRLNSGGLHVGGAADVLRLINTSATAHSAYLAFHATANSTPAAAQGRYGYVGYPSSSVLYINQEVANSHIYIACGATAGQLLFMPGNAEQARFDGTGILLVNKTATSATVLGTEVQQTGTLQLTRLDAGAPLVINKQVGATASSPFAHWRLDNTAIGSITRNAATSAVLYNTTSQIDLKGAIDRLDGEVAIALIKKWEPIRFQFRFDDEGRMSARGKPGRDFLHGFDAEKMHKLVPYAVAPGRGTEAEHRAWEKRKAREYKLAMAYNEKQAEYDRRTMELNKAEDEGADPDECQRERRKLNPPTPPPAPDPYDEDPFVPWGMDHSMLVPDLSAAFLGLVKRVEDQADELRALRKLLDKR